MYVNSRHRHWRQPGNRRHYRETVGSERIQRRGELCAGRGRGPERFGWPDQRGVRERSRFKATFRVSLTCCDSSRLPSASWARSARWSIMRPSRAALREWKKSVARAPRNAGREHGGEHVCARAKPCEGCRPARRIRRRDREYILDRRKNRQRRRVGSLRSIEGCGKHVYHWPGARSGHRRDSRERRRPGLVETGLHAANGEPGRMARLSPSIPMQRGGHSRRDRARCAVAAFGRGFLYDGDDSRNRRRAVSGGMRLEWSLIRCSSDRMSLSNILSFRNLVRSTCNPSTS